MLIQHYGSCVYQKMSTLHKVINTSLALSVHRGASWAPRDNGLCSLEQLLVWNDLTICCLVNDEDRERREGRERVNYMAVSLKGHNLSSECTITVILGFSESSK